ncbi:hypothetical protein F4604DRAFT_1949156 [Suillus subluteus]|nr:hypothetical protein F4604DRAFT_1949156 [Suillus subluteus]
MSFTRGIYFIQNKDIPGVLSPGIPQAKFATLHVKWPWNHSGSSNSRYVFPQLWLVDPLPSNQGIVYTIRNLSSGKYLTSRNGSSVVLDDPTHTTADYWIITSHPSGYSRITNFDWRKSIGGQNPNHYYTILGQNRNERWDFGKPLSCSGAEIDRVLNAFRRSVKPTPDCRRLKGYTPKTGLYLIPSRGIFEEIRLAIKKTKYRNELYDCDDFTFEFKAAVAAWFTDKIGIDASSSYHLAHMIDLVLIIQGIAIFCGMMFEQYFDNISSIVPVNGHVYNFTLSDDHRRLQYYEPQNGRLPVRPPKYPKSQIYLAWC